MKNECNIVKDLLPLCIDGAASEDSRQLVEEHTALCEDCARERREMLLALPENQKPQEEQDVLEKAARKLRRERKRRINTRVVIGVLLSLLLIIGGRSLVVYLRYNHCVPVGLEDYEMRLSYLESGRMVCSILNTGVDISTSRQGEPTEDGQGWHVNFCANTTHIPNPAAVPPYRFEGAQSFQWRDGKIYTNAFGEETQITLITRSGAHGEVEVLYEYGVDESRLLPASEEMEEYYWLEDVMSLYRALRFANSWTWSVIDESALPFTRDEIDQDRAGAIWDELYAQQWELLEFRVPEWQ